MARMTWQPDTHPGTEIELEYDETLPPEQMTHTAVRVTVNGVDQPDPGNRGRVALQGNQRKNQSVEEVLANLPDAKREYVQWTYDPATEVTTLRIVGVTLTANQRRTIRDKLAARFGTSVVLAP